MAWKSTVFLVALVTLIVVVRVGNTPACGSVLCQVTGFIGCPSRSAVTGHVNPSFKPVLEAFASNLQREAEYGGHITVYHKGALVVDIVGGFVDADRSVPYRHDTLQQIFSSTKVFESVAIAMLVDRGLLDYNKPVAEYWPEFGQNGKEKTTVADLMSHGGGVPWLDEPVDLKNFDDLETFGAMLAATHHQDAAWRGSGHQAYHAVSRGWFSSQLLHRVDPQHRWMAQFVQEEIIRPLGEEGNFSLNLMAETHPDHKSFRSRVGPLISSAKHRIINLIPRVMLPAWLADILYHEGAIPAHLVEYGQRLMAPDASIRKSCQTMKGFDFDNWEPYRQAGAMSIEGPSHTGLSHAGVLAKLANVLAYRGSFGGVTLLSPATVALLEHKYPVLYDDVLACNLTYTVGGFGHLCGFARRTVGWGGAGGSLIQWDHELELAFAYTMNYYDDFDRAYKYLDAALASVQAIHDHSAGGGAKKKATRHDEV